MPSAPIGILLRGSPRLDSCWLLPVHPPYSTVWFYSDRSLNNDLVQFYTIDIRFYLTKIPVMLAVLNSNDCTHVHIDSSLDDGIPVSKRISKSRENTVATKASISSTAQLNLNTH